MTEETIGTRIAARLEEIGMTQSALAEVDYEDGYEQAKVNLIREELLKRLNRKEVTQ